MTKIVPVEGSEFAVEADGLVKTFGRAHAVDHLSLQVPAGAVYGLLGPNGAGKSTVIRIFATLLRPDAGSARVLGHDVLRESGAVRARISLTGQFASVDEDLTGRENLLVLARLLGHTRARSRVRASELLESFALTDAADRSVRTYSGGMRRRLDIAASVIVRPDLLFLDEPTTGLDPQSRNQVWEIVRELVREGTTVLLTTQYLEEADRLAQRIAVIDHGKVIAEGTSGELKASLGQRRLRVRLDDADRHDDAQHVLSLALGSPVRGEPDPAALTVRLPIGQSGHDIGEQVSRALALLSDAGLSVCEIGVEQPSLDDVFLSLTGARSTSGEGAA
jgi:ABC-2 type transport system ATP-binding protein